MAAVQTTRREAGFTLVEMLVALLIFSIIAVAGTAMTRFVLVGRGELGDRQARATELQVARAILRSDLLNAVARPGRDAEGRGARGFTGGMGGFGGAAEREILSFLRGGWENPGLLEDRGPLLHVAYVLQDQKLLRRTALRPDPTAQTPVTETVLLDGVRSLTLEFLSGTVWVDSWGSMTGERTPSPPPAVALELEMEGLGRIRQLFLTGEGAR